MYKLLFFAILIGSGDSVSLHYTMDMPFMVYDISWSNPCLLLHGMEDFTAICMSNRECGYKLQLTLHQFFYTQLI